MGNPEADSYCDPPLRERLAKWRMVILSDLARLLREALDDGPFAPSEQDLREAIKRLDDFDAHLGPDYRQASEMRQPPPETEIR
jgi:hypothetical protein